MELPWRKIERAGHVRKFRLEKRKIAILKINDALEYRSLKSGGKYVGDGIH